MSPAEKWLGGAGQGFLSMVAQGWTVCRCPPQGAAWARCSAMLLVALISALQHPVQGSVTVQPDAGILIGESWPTEELSSSATSEILSLYGQEEIQNTTLFYNTTSTSKKPNETSPTTFVQENMSVQSEELGPSNSPLPSTLQPTNPGLNYTSILPYNLFSSGEDGFISPSSIPPPSSSPSSSSSSSPSSSSPLPYQASLSVTDVYYKSSTVPYFDKNLTQDTVTDAVNSSSNATSNGITIYTTGSWETTKNGTIDLVEEKQSLKTTLVPWQTDPALDTSSGDSLGKTKTEMGSSTLAVTSLSKTSSIPTLSTLPYKSVVSTRNTESDIDSFSISYKPSPTFYTTFLIPLDTLGDSSLESRQVETHTTRESSPNFNTSTFVPMTHNDTPSSTEQLSSGFIAASSYYFTDTTMATSEETSVEATNSSFELRTSPNVMMSTMSVTTSTLVNPSTAFVSVQPSNTTNDEHTIGSSLSDGLSTMIYNTGTNTDNTMSNITDLLTSTLQNQNLTEVTTSSSPIQSNSYSEEITSQITISVVPSTNRSTTTEEVILSQHTQSATNDTTSWTSDTPLVVTPSPVTYSTDTRYTSSVFTDNQNGNTILLPTIITMSTFEDSTSDLAVSMKLSTIESLEVASSVETTTLPTSLDTTSDMALWTSNEMVNVTSPLETIESSEVASSVKTTTLPMYLDTTSDMALWTSNEMVNVTSPLETIESSEQVSSVKTTTLPTSLDTTTSDMALWTSNEIVTVTSPLETIESSEVASSVKTTTLSISLDTTSDIALRTSNEIGNVTSPLETIESSEVASSVKTTTLPISLDTTSDMALWTSNEIEDVTSPLEINTSTAFYSHSDETLASETPLEISTFTMINDTSTNTEIQQTGEATNMTTSSQEESSLMPTVPEPIISTLSTLSTTVELTPNLGVSEMTFQSTVTTDSEMLTFSWISTAMEEISTSTKNMEDNSSPLSIYTSTSIVNDTTSFRSTNPKSSTSYQSSPFPTSNFEKLSTNFNTNSERSTSNTAGVSEVTSILESTVGSTVITPSNAVTPWTITDNTTEQANVTLLVTLNISSTSLSSQPTNIDTKTESLQKSTTWDISSPQLLSSGVTTPLLSTITQPIGNVTDYMSSTTQITTVSGNTSSHGTIMLSNSQSTDYSIVSTVQASSRNSEYQTSSDDLQSTTTNSPYTLLSQTSTQTESSAATTVDMLNSNKSTTHIEDTTMSMLETTSHLSSTTTTSTHSSSFLPLMTTNFPTNISDSLSTVSSVVSSAEVSTASTTRNATQTFTSPEKPSPSSSVTLTTPTTHVSPSIIYTLLSTRFTKSAQTPTLGVTTDTTHFTPTNHTTHTSTTVVPPTTLQVTTFTSPLSITTHTPSTGGVTSVSDTKVSTVLPHTITSSTTASTTTSVRTSVASVTPTRSVTVVNSTVLTTLLSTSTTPSSFECTLSTQTMVKTVLTLMDQPLNAQTETIVQIFEEFLNFTLHRALNQSIQVFVNKTSLNLASQPRNVTVGYSVSVNSSVYIPSAIVDVLTGNDIFNITELKLRIPTLQSVPVTAETWEPDPDISFRVKTVLKLMGTGANVHTCVYIRNMEQRLQTAFERAELTSTGASSKNLSVQILSTSKDIQILTLIYVVKNNSNTINGTTASSLLNVLSGEVVGYYLGDPPSIIAEPLYYPNIDISASTMNYWVYTVIQGVDSQLLGSNNQSFARQMEERLAKLFQISGQQSRRFKRATAVGSYTVQMVKMQRLDGPNNLAELTYYALKDGQPILGTVAAKQLSTIDPQTMALTLGYIVRVQANSVVQKPPNNLWIIAAVLAPIAVVTVIIIIITAVLCRKNKSDFKADNISNIPPRTKPVQGFDYAKQHLGQQGGDEDMLPVTQETVVPSLNLSQERDSTKDGSTEKMLKSSDHRKSRSPCENGSVISNESEEASSDGSTPQKVMAQHRVTKDEAGKRNGFPKQKRNKKIVPISDEEEGNIHFDKSKMMSDPFDSSSGSVQLIAIKPVSIPPALTVSERNQEMSIINGEVNKALKQKSDIEHYRNKLRLKAKRKGYYDFPPIESKSLNDRKRKVYDKTQMEIDNVLDAGTDTSSPFAEPKNRQTSMKNHPYRSRQSLNSPSPGETEMDLLVTRERPRRGIRNSGYDTEPEMIEETNIDRVKQARTYIKSRQAKGHSETSTLSSQPSIDEVRQQMHMLLEEAFSLASAGHGGSKRQADPYASVQHMPYSEVVTSAPGTMSRPRMQWVPTYAPEMYQYSLPRPNYRFSQLPDMVMGSPPPPVPPRTGPVAVPSLRRSTSDMANKSRISEPGGNDQGPGEHVGFPAVSRGPVPVAQTDQSVSNYSGNSMPAVFAIPGNRAGYSGYYIPQPPASYRNQAWMSYSGENDLPGQWADSVPLPGYIEAYPRSRYPQNSPSRLPRQFGQPGNLHSSLDHATGPSIGASQQSLADTDTPDASITNLSTAALVKAIREEVAKLAKKQTDMFEFQV